MDVLCESYWLLVAGCWLLVVSDFFLGYAFFCRLCFSCNAAKLNLDMRHRLPYDARATAAKRAATLLHGTLVDGDDLDEKFFRRSSGGTRVRYSRCKKFGENRRGFLRKERKFSLRDRYFLAADHVRDECGLARRLAVVFETRFHG